MIAKKNSKFDFESRRVILLQAGFLIAGSFVMAAFTYKSPLENPNEFKAMGQQEITYELLAIEQPKEEIVELHVQSEQPQTTLDVNPDLNEDITETGNTSTDVEATTDVGIDSDVEFLRGDFHIGLVDVDVEEPVKWTDVEAAYVGGTIAMMKHIGNVQRYPDESRILGDQGIVYVCFVVEKDGAVSNIKIERGVSKALDREAERIVRSFPDWIPGEVNYKAVRSYVRLPIRFVLE